MADFSSGVKSFIKGECTVKVLFPVDWRNNPDVCCYQCKFFSRNNGVCQITKEVSEYPNKYIGSQCPLEFSGEILENTEEKKENEKN